MTEQAGSQRVVGHYVLEAKLGEGGMAEVWRARHESLGTPAAIKFLNRQFAGNADVEERFLNEGKRQAQLSHPNIVSVFDFIRHDGHSYLVMRFVEGAGLDVLIDRQKALLSIEQTVAIARDALAALSYAHEKGVVHRDVKPSNILVDPQGHAHLMDFGIALVTSERRVTRTGMVMGTPHYMSPEQITRPKDVDQRTDIYSFGCVLYEMLTGKPPFDAADEEGDTEFLVKQQHLRNAPAPIRPLHPAIPRGLEYITLRCLAKMPQDRFANCAEMIELLDHYRDDASFPAVWSDPGLEAGAAERRTPPPESPEKQALKDVPAKRTDGARPAESAVARPKWAALAGLAVAAALVAGVVLWHPWRRPQPPQPVAEVNPPGPIVVPPVVPPVTPPVVPPGPVSPVVPPVQPPGSGPGAKKTSPPNLDVKTPPVTRPPEKPNDNNGVNNVTPPEQGNGNPVKAAPGAKLANQKFEVELTSPLSSETSQQDDPVTARVISPAAYQGWQMKGTVSKAGQKGGLRLKKQAELSFAFDTLVNPQGGGKLPVTAEVTSYENSKGKRNADEEGSLIEAKNSDKAIGYGAVAGAVVGAMTHKVKGAVIGSAVGAAVGLTVATVAVKAPELKFAPGSKFTLSVSTRTP